MDTVVGDAKVQKSNENLFIYIPVGKCNRANIVKGSRVFYRLENSGEPPEGPNNKAWKAKITEEALEEHKAKTAEIAKEVD